MPARLSIRARDERGYTLLELLIAMSLSLVVVGAAFSLVSASERSSKRVRDRVDAAQRGRVALDQVTQELRAMACVPPTGATTYTSPIVSATGDQITFETNLVDPDKIDPNRLAASGANTSAGQAAAFASDQRRLAVVRNTAGAVTGIREDRDYVAATNTYRQSRLIITGIAQARANAAASPKPIFQYLPYAADPTAAPTPLDATAGLSATDRIRVAQVRVSFRALPSEGSRDGIGSVDLQSSVYARTFDSTKVESGTGQTYTFDRTFRCQ